MSQHKLHARFFLLRWHRRVGLIAALGVVLMVVTGMLINHGHELHLDKTPLKSPALLKLYGVSAAGPELHYPVGAIKVYDWQGRLYADKREIGRCEHLLAVMPGPQGTLAVCGTELYLLSAEGELIDRLDRTRGFPEGVSAAGLSAGAPALQGKGGLWIIDPLTLDLVHQDAMVRLDRAVEAKRDPVWSASIASSLVPSDITVERFLLDLHSWRFFGSLGPWILDALALLFLCLACSGLWLGLRRTRR